MAKGKKYPDATKRFDRDHLHTVAEAVDLVKSLATAEFDETVELAVRLGVDPRKADQMVRGTVALPSGTGKDVRVAVFAQGAAAERGPPGRAPTSSAPTTWPPRSRAACSTSTWPSPPPTSCRWSAGSAGCSAPVASCRTRRPARSPPTWARPSRSSRAARSSTAPTATATCTCPWARSASSADALIANLRAVLDELQRAKPASSKGRYLRRIALSSTMGPGVKVDPNRLQPTEEDAA